MVVALGLLTALAFHERSSQLQSPPAKYTPSARRIDAIRQRRLHAVSRRGLLLPYTSPHAKDARLRISDALHEQSLHETGAADSWSRVGGSLAATNCSLAEQSLHRLRIRPLQLLPHCSDDVHVLHRQRIAPSLNAVHDVGVVLFDSFDVQRLHAKDIADGQTRLRFLSLRLFFFEKRKQLR